jgi:hypothetical protein
MTIPDDPTQLPGWLERQLTDLDLAQLVAELSAVHGSSNQPSGSVRELLGAQIEGVVKFGLARLPVGLLRQLLREPSYLLELQDIVLSAGSPYWDRLTVGGKLDRLTEQGRQSLQAMLFPSLARRKPQRRWPWLINLTLAATLLIGLLFGYSLLHHLFRAAPPPSQIAWGWARPGALLAEGTAKAYLIHLADTVNEWFRTRPENSPALAERIDEFRNGCDQLIAATHEPLALEDRVWLVKKCQLWQDQLGEARQQLLGGEDVATVRTSVDRPGSKVVRFR